MPSRAPKSLAMVAVAVSLLWLPRSGRASTMMALDLGELSARADEVVVAEVLGAQAEPARGAIVTRVLVRVEASVQGRTGPSDELEVLVPGGELDGLGMLVQGAPRLEPGRRYLLFLERQDTAFHVVGMAQGAMPIRREAGGRLMVEPPQGLPGLVRPLEGRLQPAPSAVPTPTPLEQVTRSIHEARSAAP